LGEGALVHLGGILPPLRGVAEGTRNRGFRFAPPPATIGQALRAYNITATVLVKML
jgi:hypothetical protein